MDGGARTPSTSSSSTPRISGSPRMLDGTSPVSQRDGDLTNGTSGHASSGMLHQLASDLQVYEAKTTRFLKSLFPSRTRRETVGTESATPLDDDSIRTQQDEEQTDEDLMSDDSQNLRGFESTIEGDQVVNSEDDGEAASSASSSAVFRAYTDKRLAMILNPKAGVTTASSGAITDGGSVLPSSDGEGVARARSRSVDSKQHHPQQRSSKGSLKGVRRSTSVSGVGGSSVAAREYQRITELESALQQAAGQTPPQASSGGSPQVKEPHGTAAPNSIAASDHQGLHYASLDRGRLAAVLRIAKDDTQRAIKLAHNYSQLLDRLGLREACIDDMDEFARCGAIKIFLPARATVDARSGTCWVPAQMKSIVFPSKTITRDGSRLCTIDVRRLPKVPTSGGPAAKKQYAAGLMRFLLYILEDLRFHMTGGAPRCSLEGGETATALAVPMDTPLPTTIHRYPSEQQSPTATSTAAPTQTTTTSTDSLALMPPTKKTKTKRMLGGNGTRRNISSSSSKVNGDDAFTFLVDVGGCDSGALGALATVLSEGEELLCQAYPLSIVRIVVHQGLLAQSSEQDGTEARSTPGLTKKQGGPVMSVLSSLFKPKATKGASSAGPGEVGTSTSASDSTPHGVGAPARPASFASKLWLSVSFSTWKLRFLHHTVRSRTLLADKLEPFVDLEELLRATHERAVDDEADLKRKS